MQQHKDKRELGDLFINKKPTDSDLRNIAGEDANHGLQGTEKQQKIVLFAEDNPDAEVWQVADALDTEPGYVASVLRRADGSGGYWTDLFVPWDEVSHLSGDEQEDEYIRLLTEACEEIESELPEL